MFKQGTTEYFLTAKECEHVGEVGITFNSLNIEDAPFVAFNGTIVAHDIIEHVNGIEHIGTVSDEFQALGGVIFTRLDMHRVTEQSLMNALLSLISRIYDGIGPFIPPQPETDDDNVFEWIIAVFRELVKIELSDEKLEFFPMEEFCDQALQGMRLGYTKQKERFKSKYDACETFIKIEDAINSYFKLPSEYSYGASMLLTPEYEGQEFILTVINDEGDIKVVFDENYPECEID